MTPEPSKHEAASAPNPSPSEGPHFVLRRGEILGPFEVQQLKTLIKDGTLEEDDFVQQVGNSEWLPLRWLMFPGEARNLEGAMAPTWRTLLKWAWLRLRYALDEQSFSAGWVCLGFALVGLLLSRWPVLLWGPWAVLAFFGGVALYRRERQGAGIALMLASAIVPGALWAYFYLGSASNGGFH